MGTESFQDAKFVVSGSTEDYQYGNMWRSQWPQISIMTLDFYWSNDYHIILHLSIIGSKDGSDFESD